MRVVIVGWQNGKAVVRWRQYLGLSFILSMILTTEPFVRVMPRSVSEHET